MVTTTAAMPARDGVVNTGPTDVVVRDGQRGARTVRGGWKCTGRYLLENLTEAERSKLKHRKVHVPSVPCKLSRSQEKQIRRELRKVRNVASAQRHREWMKGRLDGLMATERANAVKIGWLRDKVARLEGDVARLEAENVALASDAAMLALSSVMPPGA